MKIPNFPNFKKIDIVDKKQIEEITSFYPPFSDFNFTSLHSWNTEGKTFISILNNNLVLKMKDYQTNKIIFSLIGHNEINKTIDHLFNQSSEKIKKLSLVPETNFKIEKNILNKYLFEEERDHFDYIYDLREISKMTGGKFRKKRKLSRIFEKDNKVSIKIFKSPKSNIYQQITDLIHVWAKKKSKSFKDFKNELVAIKKTSKIIRISKLIIIVMYVDKKMIGFTISELLQNGYCMIHFGKTDQNIKGSSEYIMKVTAKNLVERGVRYSNWQQDLGIPGIRQSKLSYYPHSFLKKYSITPIN